ncbi:MAG: DUF2267 domain-containing protein [Actinobacteria bacterium]|nr:DUF2267 domain-containing protein [Actinomycetota bacterium]
MGHGSSNTRSRLDDLRYLSRGEGPAWKRFTGRVIDLRHIGWDVVVKAMERTAGHRRGARPDSQLRASTRDLLVSKSRAVRQEVEALADAVMRAGHYSARDDATRAVNAVMDVVRERVPPELFSKLTEHLPSEAARLRRAASDRLARDDSFPRLTADGPGGEGDTA